MLVKILKKIVEIIEGRAQSSANLIPYMFLITQEYVLNKDGSICTFFEYEGKDADSISDEEKDLNAASLENSIRLLGGKITLNWHINRRLYESYPNKQSGKNPVSQQMANLYEDDFKKERHYQNKHVLALVYHAPYGADRFFDKFSFYMNKQKENFVYSLWYSLKDLFSFTNAYDYDARQLDIDVREFTEIIKNFQQSTPVMKMKQLKGSELITYLYGLVNPASNANNINLPNSMMLDAYLPDNHITIGEKIAMFEGGNKKKYVSAISIKDYASHTSVWVNDLLAKSSGEVLISHTFRLLDHAKSRAIIENSIRFHEANAIPFIKRMLAKYLKFEIEPRIDAYKKMQESELALAKVNNDRKIFCWHNLTILCYGDSAAESDKLAQNVLGTLNQMGYIGVRESVGLQSAFLGVMPGQWDSQPRRQILSITNMSDLCPINTLQMGKAVNPWLSEQAKNDMEAMSVFRTRFGIPYMFNFHQGSLGHMITIGPAGSGKTVWESLMTMFYQKYNPVTIVFDKDKSCMIPIIMQGGGYIDITNGKVKFNPLKLLADEKHWSWIANFIEQLLTARNEKFTTEHSKVVWEAITNLKTYPPEHWRLSRLSALLSTELSERLEMWLEGNRYGYLFDNELDTFDFGDFSGLEMGELIKNHPMAATVFMDYAFYRLDLKFDGKRPGLINIQEAWFMMGNEKFASRLDDWLRTMRKRNVVVMLSTQSMQEINDSDFVMSFLDNIPNRIFLPNPTAKSHIRIYKRLFNLTDHQILEIENAIPNRNYYYVTQDNSCVRMFDIPIKKDLLAYLRADGRAIETFIRHVKSGRPEWRANYLKEITA